MCDTYKVALEKCYFFSEFRDDQATSIERRKSTWSGIICEHIHGLHAKAAGAFSSNKSHDRSEIRVPWSFSKASEIAALVAQYYVKRESWILKAVYNTQTSVDPDYTHAPPPNNVGIRKLLDTRQKIWEDDMIKIIGAIEELWPPFKDLGIRPEEIRAISDGLRSSKMTLEYYLTRAFIGTAVPRIRTAVSKRRQAKPLLPRDFGRICIETREPVLFLLGPVEPARSVVATRPQLGDRVDELLDIVIQRNKELIAYSEKYGHELQDWVGDSFLGMSQHQIATEFRELSDVDSAKAWMLQSQRKCWDAKDRGVIMKLRAFNEILEKMRTGWTGN
ncbi:MAG: hypothetical protein Q9199_001850 [Rusavskia elegans]